MNAEGNKFWWCDMHEQGFGFMSEKPTRPCYQRAGEPGRGQLKSCWHYQCWLSWTIQCVCVCVCVSHGQYSNSLSLSLSHTHTHTHFQALSIRVFAPSSILCICPLWAYRPFGKRPPLGAYEYSRGINPWIPWAGFAFSRGCNGAGTNSKLNEDLQVQRSLLCGRVTEGGGLDFLFENNSAYCPTY